MGPITSTVVCATCVLTTPSVNAARLVGANSEGRFRGEDQRGGYALRGPRGGNGVREKLSDSVKQSCSPGVSH